jgi:catechol 2,3-dioxygenase-like lactoylglutathione lyase family enzyme
LGRLRREEDAVFDHVSLNVSDYEVSKQFYEQTLAPLGYSVRVEFADWKSAGFGAEGVASDFWIGERDPTGTGMHVAFQAPDRATVDAFHAAGLAAGGADNGAPGIRGEYHPTYYGAYVLDPDGNNIEAVCHKPE